MQRRTLLVAVLGSLGQLSTGCRPAHGPASSPTPVAATITEPVAAPQTSAPKLRPPFPTPPRQQQAWTPPATRLPAELVSAATRLFAIGLADPRGCEYREVEIVVGDVWGGTGSPQKTHAWVLPGSTPPAAVGWNGLVYRTRSVGAPANVGDDVRALVAADAAARDKAERDNPGSGEHHRFPSTAEGASLSLETMQPLKVALLLRLGEGALAEQFWSAFASPGDHHDPFSTLATDWLWAGYDRAVTAHMRVDDDLALESARPLPGLGRLAEAECKARCGPVSQSRPEGPYPHFEFLGNVALLIADEERRLTEPHPTFDPASLAGLGAQERVDALITALDQVAERQWGQPGGVDLAASPIVEALVAQGDLAVEPLLDVLEHDTRLTRTVHFWRDFAMSRSLLGVHEAAYVALASLLDTSAFEGASTGDDLSARGMEGRRDVARRLRAFYAQWKGVAAEERWYRTLSDDAAKPEAWLDAAGRITQPGNVVVHPNAGVWQTTVSSAVAPGQKPALRGEPLRGKVPSVADLLARRTESTASNTRMSCEMARALGAWDARAGAPTMARQVERAAQASAATPGKHEFASCIVALTLLRAEAHDPHALTDYERWITSTSAQGMLSDVPGYFEPMWRFATDPAMVRAARKTFGSGSGWLPLVPTKKVDASFAWYVLDLIDSPLLGVPSFRSVVLAALADRHTAGSTRALSSGSVNLQMLGGWQTGQGVDANDPLAPAEGAVQDVRVCDVVAAQLSRRDHAPRFRYYWPTAARDAALPTMAAYVRSRP